MNGWEAGGKGRNRTRLLESEKIQIKSLLLLLIGGEPNRQHIQIPHLKQKTDQALSDGEVEKRKWNKFIPCPFHRFNFLRFDCRQRGWVEEIGGGRSGKKVTLPGFLVPIVESATLVISRIDARENKCFLKWSVICNIQIYKMVSSFASLRISYSHSKLTINTQNSLSKRGTWTSEWASHCRSTKSRSIASYSPASGLQPT